LRRVDLDHVGWRISTNTRRPVDEESPAVLAQLEGAKTEAGRNRKKRNQDPAANRDQLARYTYSVLHQSSTGCRENAWQPLLISSEIKPSAPYTNRPSKGKRTT
jgi:hypothetical protein